MGENFDIKAVEAINGGTDIQVDFRSEMVSGRMFIPTRDILKAINNYAQYAFERECLAIGMEKVDPEAPPSGLIL